MSMEQEKKATIAVGMLVAVVLFVAVFLWFRQDRLAEVSMTPVQKATESKGTDDTALLPVAEPETPEDVTANIEAQMAEDAAALEAEMAAETAAIDAEAASINDLSEAYDESSF